MITIKDIAKQVGVSPTTVSNVIHGNTKRVSSTTLKKIEKALKENKYIPSMAARMLTMSNSNIIGVISTYPKLNKKNLIKEPFIGEILGALEEEIRIRGYFMMFYASEDVIDIFKLASTWNVTGLIVLGFNEKDCVNLRKQMGPPFVTIDTYFNKFKNENFVNVGLDDYNGGYLMGNYLINKGHKNILFMADNTDCVYENRWLGLKSAMEENGINCNKENNFYFLKEDENDRKIQYKSNIDFIKNFTALFYPSDYYAVEGINIFKELGINIPDELSIVGFDDNIFASIVRPKLTTIKQNIPQRAKEAVDLLIKISEYEDIEEKNKIFPVELIERDSVLDLNKNKK